MALLDAFRTETQLPTFDRPVSSESRKKLRWLIDKPPADLSKLMVITPDMATAMLELNASDEWHNRPESEKATRRYVLAMKRGWVLTGETIVFSKSGRLLNGQHRLSACIQSGENFECIVVFGIEDNAFKFMDIGTTRTASHIFNIEDIPNYAHAAATARLLYGYKAKSGWEGVIPDVENDTLLDFYYQHPRIQDAIAHGRALNDENLMRPSWGSFCFYICAEKNREEARAFFDKVATGIGISNKASQEYRIRKRLLENAQSTAAKISNGHLAAFIVQAWNAKRSNDDRRIYRWRNEQSPNEAFPRAI